MSNKPFRYPGAQPFETRQKSLFFGREKTAQKLYRLIKLERLVVLHSKSGLGKSSLLNASIIPKILEDDKYHPLRIRFNAWVEGQSDQLPLSTTAEVIRGGKKSVLTFLDKLISKENTLWHDIKEFQIKSKNQKSILLIFDQFEELFTYPKAEIEAFGKQLNEALSVSLPQRYWNRLETMDEGQFSNEELHLLQQPTRLKIVLAIRSDRMSYLDTLSGHLPTILKNCFELNPLDLEQAKAAILLPAKSEGDFISKPFGYDLPALENILVFLTQDEKQGIETTQLQIVCTAMEKRAMAYSLSQIRVEDTTDLGALIKKYYDEKIELLKTHEQQQAARQLIEEQLIFEDEERRISLYEGQILNSGVTEESLKILVDSHLLRAEPSPQGGFTYELSHDTLVAPVLESKKKRIAILAQERLAQERLIREDELKEARQKLIVEQQRAEEQTRLRAVAETNERRARQRTRLATFGFIVALLGVAFSAWFWKDARDANIETEKALSLANDREEQAKASNLFAQKEAIKAKEQKILAEYNDSIATEKAAEAVENLEKFHSSFANFLVSETERALGNENIRLALRLNQEALKMDKKNKKARSFSKAIPLYSSQYFLEGQNFKLNQDSSFITIKIREEEDNNFTLNVLSLKGNIPPRVFKNCINYHYSGDGKFLTFWTKGTDEKFSTLNVLELNNKKPERVFKKCENNSASYSTDNKYLTYWTQGKNNTYNVLNVLNLSSPSPAKTFENCKKYSDSFSLDGKYLTFLTNHSTGELATLNILDLNNSASHRTFENCDSRSFAKLSAKEPGKRDDLPEFHTVISNETLYGIFRKYGVTVNDLKKMNNLTSNDIRPNQQLRISSPPFENFSGGSSNSRYLSFWTKEDRDSSTQLNVLDLEKEKPRIFENSDNLQSRYSNDNNHLTFWTKGTDGKSSTLNLLNLMETAPPLMFENSDSSNYRFTKDSKHLIFWNKKEGVNQLQIIALDGKTPPRVFENCIPLIDRMSPDNQYFVFWTKGRRGQFTTLNILDLESKNEPQVFKNSHNLFFKFSNDSENLLFSTKKENESMISFNLLKLKGGYLPRVFENCSESNFKFSDDSKYLSFLTKDENENMDVVKVLKLNKNTEPIIVKSTTAGRFRYSKNNKYLTFWAKGKEGKFTTLMVQGLHDKTYFRFFENALNTSFGSSYDNKYLAFRIKGRDGQFSILNVLELGTPYHPRTFENCGMSYFGVDNKYLSFVEKGVDGKLTTFKVLDLQSNKILKTVYHQFPIDLIISLSDNSFMTISTHQGTKGKIYKIIDFTLGDKASHFYNKLYKDLSTAEKLRYGLSTE